MRRWSRRGFSAAAISVLANANMFFSRAYAQQQNLEILRPDQTVELEHEDRMARLERLSTLEGVLPPEFSTFSISHSLHGLPDFPGDIPVLRVVFRDQVFFDFNEDDLKPEAYAVLNLVGHSLRLDPPDVAVFIAGHTDSVGSAAYNLELGMRRAKAVASQLALLGVEQAQIFAVSFGKAVPIADNNTEDGRAKNRRVEFLFAARPEPIAAWLSQQRAVSCVGQGQYDNCEFKAVSVEVGVLKTHVMNAAPKVKEVPAATKQDVVFGRKTVDIDLTQHVYHVALP